MPDLPVEDNTTADGRGGSRRPGRLATARGGSRPQRWLAGAPESGWPPAHWAALVALRPGGRRRPPSPCPDLGRFAPLQGTQCSKIPIADGSEPANPRPSRRSPFRPVAPPGPWPSAPAGTTGSLSDRGCPPRPYEGHNLPTIHSARCACRRSPFAPPSSASGPSPVHWPATAAPTAALLPGRTGTHRTARTSPPPRGRHRPRRTPPPHGTHRRPHPAAVAAPTPPSPFPVTRRTAAGTAPRHPRARAARRAGPRHRGVRANGPPIACPGLPRTCGAPGPAAPWTRGAPDGRAPGRLGRPPGRPPPSPERSVPRRRPVPYPTARAVAGAVDRSRRRPTRRPGPTTAGCWPASTAEQEGRPWSA